MWLSWPGHYVLLNSFGFMSQELNNQSVSELYFNSSLTLYVCFDVHYVNVMIMCLKGKSLIVDIRLN